MDTEDRQDGLPSQSRPDPELQSREEAMWENLLKDFADEQRHKEYLGFCIKNNLMLAGSKRYGAYAEDKEAYPIELRRLARQKQQQLASILFLRPRVDPSLKRSGSPFGSLSGFEVGGLFAMVILLFVGFIWGGWALLLVPFSIAGLVIYFAQKARHAKEKFEDN